MKIGDLHKSQSLDIPALIADEIKRARSTFPNAGSNEMALVFAVNSLRKNLKERTEERDKYSEQLGRARTYLKSLADVAFGYQQIPGFSLHPMLLDAIKRSNEFLKG